MLKENDLVLDFTLLDDKNQKWTLSDHLDKKLVIYFYPKDNTPGCTTQACNFRDNYQELLNLNVNVVGISSDSVKSHQSFKDKKSLPFTLLSDPDFKVIKQFGTYGEKNIFQKKVIRIIRSSFIIDENGKVIKVFQKASPTKNTQEIIEYLNSIK